MKYGLFSGFDHKTPITYEPGPGDTVIYQHVYKKHFDLWGDLLNNPIVVPLRHPFRVWESYRRRGRLDRGFDVFVEQWDMMINQFHPLNPMYIHIDSDSRDQEVQAVCEALDRDLAVDWADIIRGKPGTESTFDLPLPEIMPSYLPAEYTDFYHDTISQR